MKVLFFASLKERLNCSELVIENAYSSVSELRESLCARGEPWASALSNEKLLVAINQEMAKFEDSLTDSDEVAFFPPVTGG